LRISEKRPAAGQSFLQRKCGCAKSTGLDGECSGCQKHGPGIQRRAAGEWSSGPAPSVIDSVLRSSGAPLDPRTRTFMESRFGHNFGSVRVHTDGRAAESARAVNALAYTVGQDIVFGAGKYDTVTEKGRRLLAHELTHVVQQHQGIARQPDERSASHDAALERARNFQPHFRPHIPVAPPVPAPPAIASDPLPSPCPNAAAVRAGIRDNDVMGRTETYMRSSIANAQARSAGRVITFAPSLVRQADTAIRQEYGSLLPAGRSLTASSSVTSRTPDDFAALRVPTDAVARNHIGQAAISSSEDILRSLCITDSADAALQAQVAAPLFTSLGLPFVRLFERSHIGGLTTFPNVGGVRRPHVDVPSESRNLGHIIVHEAMHFYVDPQYQRTAEANPNLEDALMEGGAEFLARGVIHQHLASHPEFQINYGTYSNYFSYVNNYLMRGGTSSFALAYFQGRVDLLGLTPQPKLEVSMPGDPYEQEADRMAEAVVGSTADQDRVGLGHDFSEIRVHNDSPLNAPRET